MDHRRSGLIFGGSGKLGTALTRAFAQDWAVRPVPGHELDVTDTAALRALLQREKPGVVFNAKVIGGVDACELDPGLAYRINTRFPAHLAELSEELGFTLVHFSTDAMLPDCPPGSAHTESAIPAPQNAYALTKHGADCLIRAITDRAYILRLSVLFGPRPAATQFLERMLENALAGEPLLRVAEDVVSTPSYSLDVAERVREMLEQDAAPGLYHVANQGPASLYDLVREAVALLGLPTRVEPVPASTFPSIGRRSRRTPLASEKAAPLRPWQAALADFCRGLKPRP